MERRRQRPTLLASLSAILLIGTTACGASNTVVNSPTATSQGSPSTQLVGSTEPSPPPTPPPSQTPTTPPPSIRQITCATFFREVETVPPTDGPVLTFDTPGTQTAEFDDLSLTAIVEGTNNVLGSLFVRVSTLPDNAQVFGGLYQFPLDPRVNSFETSGQGFTGLLYVYNPTSGSEMQIFCSAQE